MKVHGLNRAEILVADPDAAQATFTRLFNGAYFTSDAGTHGRPLECRHDWQHGLELVHPKSSSDSVGQKLLRHGEGFVLTVVFQVENLADARAHLIRNGFEIQYEGEYSRHPDVEIYRQLVLRPEQTHGFFMTLMERRWKPGAMRAVAPQDPEGMTVLGINRVRILVRDPDRAEETFARLFNGARFRRCGGHPEGAPDCRIDWDLGLELVGPRECDRLPGQAPEPDEGSVVSVVYQVDDLDAARGHVTRNGFEIQSETDYGACDDFEVRKELVVKLTPNMSVAFTELRRKG